MGCRGAFNSRDKSHKNRTCKSFNGRNELELPSSALNDGPLNGFHGPNKNITKVKNSKAKY